jgi:hypothetical protein
VAVSRLVLAFGLRSFVGLINYRFLIDDLLSESITDESFGTFVTPDNSTRVSINGLFVATSAKLLPEGEYPVRVVANFKGKLSALRRSEVRTIMSLPDTKFGRMAPYLDLIIGMPIQVTQNIRAAKHELMEPWVAWRQSFTTLRQPFGWFMTVSLELP